MHSQRGTEREGHQASEWEGEQRPRGTFFQEELPKAASKGSRFLGILLVRAAGRRHGVAAAAAAGGLERALQRRLGRQILGCAAHQLLQRRGGQAQGGEQPVSARSWEAVVRGSGCWVAKRAAVCARRHALQASAAGPAAESASLAGCWNDGTPGVLLNSEHTFSALRRPMVVSSSSSACHRVCDAGHRNQAKCDIAHHSM